MKLHVPFFYDIIQEERDAEKADTLAPEFQPALSKHLNVGVDNKLNSKWQYEKLLQSLF